MDSPEQRRKRKRFLKTNFLLRLPSRRSLLLFFSLLAFLYFFPLRVPINPSSFHPVLVVSSLSLLSSSSADSTRGYPIIHDSSHVTIEDRVSFPDHVLLLVSNTVRNGDELTNKSTGEWECVYGGSNYGSGDAFEKRDVASVEEYTGLRSIVRCPLPPANFSTVTALQRCGRTVINLGRTNQNRVYGWENLVYEAALDGDTAVVFVKGLSHRAGRESDPTQFSCHFGFRNRDRESGFLLTTKALTVAQEVVRCSLPRRIRRYPNKTNGIRVTIGITPSLHRNRSHQRILVPSVARISGPETEVKPKSNSKYELCVCTMVWNQASSLKEWIIFHSWLGVQKWFIYDNNSDDATESAISEMESLNYNVSRHVWPWIKTQEAGFSHCALKARDKCKWVSFMDVDEYFYFPFPSARHNQVARTDRFPGQNSLKNLVLKFSNSYPNIGEIRTSCHSFGPSGLSGLPPQGVTVGYTCRLQSPERHKSIVRPNTLDPTLLNVVHHFRLRKGFKYWNLHQSVAVINHYKYQVWESFRAKFYRRVATYVADWQENQNEGSRDRAPGLGREAIEPPNWRLRFCEVWDTGLRDFVMANLADPSSGSLPWERSTVTEHNVEVVVAPSHA